MAIYSLDISTVYGYCPGLLPKVAESLAMTVSHIELRLIQEDKTKQMARDQYP